MTDDPAAPPSRRGGPLPTEQAEGGLWMIDLKHATKTDGSTGAGTPGDGIIHDTTTPTVTEVPTVIMEPTLYTSQPMNSGTDFVTRRMPVASPVMASGQSLGDQGGDVVLVPVADPRPIPIDFRQTSRGDVMTPGKTGGPPGTGVGQPGDPAFTVSERGQAVYVPQQPIPIHADAMRANSSALTPSPPAGGGKPYLRDPGLGVGDPGDPMFTLSASVTHAVAFDPASAQDQPSRSPDPQSTEGQLTHASFFSGVGGLDLGLERSGWRTVSFSEIDPYACAVLAHHWPDVPNLGSIVTVAARLRPDGGELRTGEAGPAALDVAQDRDRRGHRLGSGDHAGRVSRHYASHTREDIARRLHVFRLADGRGLGQSAERADLLPVRAVTDAAVAAEPVGRAGGADDADWTRAVLWSGGFPCQDLSIAGKRRGMGTHDDRVETRSGLAYAFLDLVERYRPPAILFENVPGLLSSNRGRDLGALVGRLGELGYGWAFRVLDAQHSGVPQRRRRVFVVALRRGGRPDAEGAAEVLAVGSRCERDHQAEREAWARTPGRARSGSDVAGTVLAREGKGVGFQYPDDHLIPSTGELASGLRTSDHLRGDGSDNLIVGSLTASMATGNHNGQDDHSGFLTVIRDDGDRDAGPGRGERAGIEPGRDGAVAAGSIGGLDPADDLPAGFIVATDHLARAVHTSTGRRSGPAGDEVAGLIVGQPVGRPSDGGLRGHALPDGRRDGDAGSEPDERPDRDGDRARQVDGSDVASTLRGFGHGWQGQHNSTNAVVVANSTGHGWWNEDDGIAGTVRTDGKVDATLIISEAPDSRGDGETDGMARRMDDRADMEGAGEGLKHFRKSTRAASVDHDETWVPDDVTNTVNTFDIGDARTTELVAATLLAPGAEGGRRDKMPMTAGQEVGGDDDPMLPEGLDSHRYRCCGNGVVTPVAEWVGARIAVWAREAAL